MSDVGQASEQPPQWDQYADLADDVAIPTIGVRALAYVSEDGKRGVAWCVDADDEQLYLMVGLLEKVKADLCAMLDEDGGDE